MCEHVPTTWEKCKVQGARASLDDLAVRWETPRGREIKEKVIADIMNNKGRGLSRVLEGFIYTDEVLKKNDLRCITLEELNLNNSNLENSDLSWSSFKKSNLSRSAFTNCSIKRASFEKADLNLSRFRKCDLSRVDFSDCKLEHGNFQDCKMTGSRFNNAYAPRASFQGARMTKCNFIGAFLEQCNFSGSDCGNTNFSAGVLDILAAKPDKMGGVRFDEDLQEFEDDVGIKALTFRSTRKFKGLDVLIRMTTMLSKNIIPATTSTTAPIASPTPPSSVNAGGMDSPPDDGFQFGAPMRTQSYVRGQIQSPIPQPRSPSPAQAPNSRPAPNKDSGMNFGAPPRNQSRRFEGREAPQNAHPQNAHPQNAPPQNAPPQNSSRDSKRSHESQAAAARNSGDFSAQTSPPSLEDYQDYRYGESDQEIDNAAWTRGPPPLSGKQTTRLPPGPNRPNRFPEGNKPLNSRRKSTPPPRPITRAGGLQAFPKRPSGIQGSKSSHTIRNRRRPISSSRTGMPQGRQPPAPPAGRRPTQTRRLPPRSTASVPTGSGRGWDAVLAAADPNWPGASGDWDEAIGVLLQNKNNITKIVLEIEGESSLYIYRRHDS